MVADSALYRVSPVVRADGHYAAERTYLLGRYHIDFAADFDFDDGDDDVVVVVVVVVADGQPDNRNVQPCLDWVESKCIAGWSKPWLSNTGRHLLLLWRNLLLQRGWCLAE